LFQKLKFFLVDKLKAIQILNLNSTGKYLTSNEEGYEELESFFHGTETYLREKP